MPGKVLKPSLFHQQSGFWTHSNHGVWRESRETEEKGKGLGEWQEILPGPIDMLLLLSVEHFLRDYIHEELCMLQRDIQL